MRLSLSPLITALVAAFGLSLLFWIGLYLGEGLIGGDMYSYFFPQKVFYAEQLAEWRIPFWNDRVGFGYPVLGESQTGALYPPNLVLYKLLSVNAAYNASQLLHYLAGMLAMFAFLRGAGLTTSASVFGAGVYMYSWFPPRICLEWAAIGAPYLPLGLLLIEKYRQKADRRWLGGLSIALAMHLLAGHYNLAFIECVVWSVYALVCVRPQTATVDERTGLASTEVERSESIASRLRRYSRPMVCLLAIAVGFALASVQLLDTVALKAAGQRESIGDTFSPGYGHIPPAYFTQLVASHLWTDPGRGDLDGRLQGLAHAVQADTNKVEAHLYLGLIPIGLVLLQLIRMVRTGGDRRSWVLVGMAGFAAVYASGVFIPLTQQLPGFGYFMGPGRWGIAVTLTGSYLAARALQRVMYPRGRNVDFSRHAASSDVDSSRCSNSNSTRAAVVFAVAAAITTADLFVASARVTYATIVFDPPIGRLEQSPVKRIFDTLPREYGPPRVYAPGQNVVTMLGVAQWPTYLGLGPAAYWDAMPPRPEGAEGLFYSDTQATWLRENAVGYTLSFEPLDAERWGLTMLWAGIDPVLNRIWGRGGQPLYLYRIEGAADSMFAGDPWNESSEPLSEVQWRPGYVEATTDAPALFIRQAALAYSLPDGWTANSRIGQGGNPLVVGVSTNGPGHKSIRFRPGYWFVSLPLTLVSLLVTGWLLWRRPSAPVTQ